MEKISENFLDIELMLSKFIQTFRKIWKSLEIISRKFLVKFQ